MEILELPLLDGGRLTVLHATFVVSGVLSGPGIYGLFSTRLPDGCEQFNCYSICFFFYLSPSSLKNELKRNENYVVHATLP
jgi:hypothetical protein